MLGIDMSCTKLRKYHRRILKFAKPAALPAPYVLFWPPRWRPCELEGFEFCYWTTQDDSESQIAIRKGYSNCGFPQKYVNNPPNSTYCQTSAAPSQEELKVSAQWGKTRVFSYKPMICWKNPGFSPKSRVNPGFAFEPEKFLGFRRLGYIYI